MNQQIETSSVEQSTAPTLRELGPNDWQKANAAAEIYYQASKGECREVRWAGYVDGYRDALASLPPATEIANLQETIQRLEAEKVQILQGVKSFYTELDKILDGEWTENVRAESVTNPLHHLSQRIEDLYTAHYSSIEPPKEVNQQQ